MTDYTLLVRYEDGMTIGLDAPDFDSLIARFRALADMRAMATLNAGGVATSDVRQQQQQDQAPRDPWGSAQPSQGPAQSRPAAAAPAPPQQQQLPDSGVVTVQTPNGLQVWTLRPQNAPACLCGVPSAHVRGTNKNGGAYNAYRCAKGAGENWRNKCDFNLWI